MRTFVPLVLIALAAIVLGRVAPAGAHQDARAISVETLGVGMPSDAPGKALLMLRVTIQPGGAFPLHTHPGGVLIVVQSGEFTFSVVEGEAAYTPAATDGTPAPTTAIPAGEEIVASPGDQIYEDGEVHTARNDGDVPTVVLVAALVDPTQPFTQPMEMGTPTS